MKRTCTALLLSIVLTLCGTPPASAAKSTASFVLDGAYMKVKDVRPGMKGYARTVLSGTEVTQFPVEIVSVIPQTGSPKHLIMIRTSSEAIERFGGIAAGMSGSPVYIGGKLLGAIGYGWDFSHHNLGLLTPYEDMISIWQWPEKPVRITALPVPKPEKKPLRDSEKEAEDELPADDGKSLKEEEEKAPAQPPLRDASSLFISGLSQRSASSITALLGKNSSMPGGSSGDLPIEENARLEPGEALAVLLAWGDVTIASTGTLTALGKDGRFIAFAHPFLGRGAVNYPVARAYIHGVVPSVEVPFKIGTPLRIVGTTTQDRAQAIGGRIGYFTPSFSAALNFTDLDRKTSEKKRFHIAPDPFMGAKLSAEIFTGLVDELWGRKGQGTAKMSLIVQGRGLTTGWSRTNMFYSDGDIAADALKEISEMLDILFLNPFSEIYPLGVNVLAEFTENPKVMFIEGVDVKKESVRPGETVDVEVTLRPYRAKETKKTFTLTVPKDATDSCEILVRGGGIEPLSQSALIQGWKTIANFQQLLTEMSAPEANNELILELNCDGMPDLRGADEEDGAPSPKEEEELLSELKKRRLEEGTLRIFSSEYVVDGLLRKILTVDPEPSRPEESRPATGE